RIPRRRREEVEPERRARLGRPTEEDDADQRGDRQDGERERRGTELEQRIAVGPEPALPGRRKEAPLRRLGGEGLLPLAALDGGTEPNVELTRAFAIPSGHRAGNLHDDGLAPDGSYFPTSIFVKALRSSATTLAGSGA